MQATPIGASTDVGPALITSADVTLEEVERVAAQGARVELAGDVMDRLGAARDVVDRALAAGQAAYGLNSGLGHGRDTLLSADDLARYQVQIVESHAAGIGPPLPDEDVRAIMFARIAGMTRGGSGAHPEVVQTLAAMLNAGLHPVVPEVGSVGASDLMHMAAIAQVAIGGGKARLAGETLPGAIALAQVGLAPCGLRPKDALSLISGNGTSIGLGALAVLEAERIADLADLAGVLTLEAIEGGVDPFDEEVAAAKPFPGQIAAAAHIRALLDGSDLAGRAGPSLQDPLSLRVMPQVHGALREQITAARRSVETELNAVDDNPYVSVANDRLISNGNFHPLVLALAFESLRVGLAHAGALAERRMNKVASFSFGTGALYPKAEDGDTHTPGRYAEEGVLAYSAAALSARLKHLASPVTLGCPPLDRDVEDHATLAPLSVALTREALQQLETILVIEALLAADKISSLPPRILGTGARGPYSAILGVLEGAGGHTSLAELIEQTRAVLP
ncbi:MAG TPA: aromatic amino acid ammonia-lyase [Chloroflexota bacterium]